MTIVSSDIQKAIQLLSQDDLVAIPTETVYGLGGNIFSERAIRKIFELWSELVLKLTKLSFLFF